MYYANGPEDIPTTSQLLSMSRLEFMQRMLAGELPAPPISRLLNYRLSSVEHGRVSFRGAPQFEQSNPMGSVPGGWYGTLLDSALGCAVMTCVPKGSVYTTLEYKVNIIRSIPVGTEIIATATTDHAGRSTGIAHGEIRGTQDDRLYATASTTCIIMTPSPEAK